MRSVLAVLCLFVAGSSPVLCFAQDFPRAEVFGGYSYLNVDTNGLSSRKSANGWEAGVAGNFTRLLGVEFDGAGYYRTISGVSVSDYSYLAGPRLSLRPVFVHALVGGDHLTGSASGGSASQDGLAGAFGGGIQWPIAGHWALRASGDYVFSRHNILGGSSVTQNNFRAGAGIAYSFGGIGKSTGSSGQPTTPSTLASMPIPALGLRAGTQDKGAEIIAIEPGGVGELAGLHPGDVINEIDGRPIRTAMELAAEMATHVPGSRIRLGYVFRSTALGYFQKDTIIILGQKH